MNRSLAVLGILAVLAIAACVGGSETGPGSAGMHAAMGTRHECDPNYNGACLDPTASDYDCEGGSGDGPEYTGTVTVVGEDHYGLDSDGDGIGCE